MSEYRAKVAEEAARFLEKNLPDFENDAGEFGGGSAAPNLSRWIDRTGRLTRVVEEAAKGWTKRDLDWIQENSRNSVPYGDPLSSAFAAFYKDILAEIKKIRKKRAGF